jgi:hypothetical protein
MERFVLAYPNELHLDEKMTMQNLEEISENSNLNELLLDKINQRMLNNPVEISIN